MIVYAVTPRKCCCAHSAAPFAIVRFQMIHTVLWCFVPMVASSCLLTGSETGLLLTIHWETPQTVHDGEIPVAVVSPACYSDDDCGVSPRGHLHSRRDRSEPNRDVWNDGQENRDPYLDH